MNPLDHSGLDADGYRLYSKVKFQLDQLITTLMHANNRKTIADDMMDVIHFNFDNLEMVIDGAFGEPDK